MIGGGVPKNFAQDTVVCAEILGEEVPMHKYAVQIYRGRRARRCLLQFHAQRSQFLGQGGFFLRYKWFTLKRQQSCRFWPVYAYHKGSLEEAQKVAVAKIFNAKKPRV